MEQPQTSGGTGGRQSNLELLRILCVIAIVADHFITQNGLESRNTIPESFFYASLISLSRAGCSAFVIISAWFSADRPFRFRKAVHVWLTVATFCLPVLIWGLMDADYAEALLLKLTYPVEERPLWFAGYYIILVLFSPALNMLIREGSRRLTEYVLLVFGILMTGYSTVTARTGALYSDLWPMLFLYILTGYWKKYREIPSLSRAVRWFLIAWIPVTCGRVIGAALPPGTLSGIIAQYAEAYRSRMQTLPNLAMAYGLFFIFFHLRIRQSRVINRLAGLSLGVYCFHQLPGWYPYLWNKVMRTPFHAANLTGAARAAYTLAGIAAVWIAGSLAELVRARAARLLIEDRRWFARVCGQADRLVNREEEAVSATDRKWIRGLVIIAVLWFLMTPVLFGSQLYQLFR